MSFQVSTPADQESAWSKFLTDCYAELHCKTYEKTGFFYIPEHIQDSTIPFLLASLHTPISVESPLRKDSDEP